MLKALRDIQREGFPDWKEPCWCDEESYSYTDDMTHEQWAWEFLRRNPDYREEWAGWAQRLSDAPERKPDIEAIIGQVARTSEGAPSASQVDAMEATKALKKWHLLLPYDPAFPISKGAPIWAREVRQWEPFMLGDPGDDGLGQRYSRINKVRALSDYADFGPHVQAFALSLDHPIPAQLDLVRQQIDDYQKEHGLNTEIKPRDRREKWRLYLRALDGKTAGAKLLDIGRCLRLDNEYNTDGITMDKTSKTINRAKQLGEHGPTGYARILELSQRHS